MNRPKFIFFKETNCVHCDVFLNNEWQDITSDRFLSNFLDFEVYVFSDNPKSNYPIEDRFSFVDKVPYFAIVYGDIIIDLGACEKSRKYIHVVKHTIINGLIPLFRAINQDQLANKLLNHYINTYKGK